MRLGESVGSYLQQRFVAGPWIDQATDFLPGEGVVQAGLVAGDAGIDLVFTALPGLVHKLRVREHGARHGHEVRVAGRQYLLGDIGHINAVAGNGGNAQLFGQAPGDTGKGGAGHAGGNSRYCRFVPGEVGADDIRTCLLDRLPQLHHFLPGHAALQHVHGGDPENDDEVVAHRRANAAHHLDRKAHAVLVTAAPPISALVGLRHQEGTEQITGGADDFHAVVARLARAAGAVGKVRQLLLDAGLVQRRGHRRRDAGFDG